jgi:hypothetical protein
MLEDRQHYRTCIVRAWRVETLPTEEEIWRLTLEVPALGLRKGFSSFQELAETMWLHLSTEEDDHPDAPELPDA